MLTWLSTQQESLILNQFCCNFQLDGEEAAQAPGLEPELNTIGTEQMSETDNMAGTVLDITVRTCDSAIDSTVSKMGENSGTWFLAHALRWKLTPCKHLRSSNLLNKLDCAEQTWSQVLWHFDIPIAEYYCIPYCLFILH